MEKVRIGVIGSRFAADFHCDAYSRSPYAQLVAVAALDNLEPFCRKWRIPAAYEDFREMLAREDLDLVSICIPNFLHHDAAVAASEAGIDAVCEKPLATTIADARHMIEVCRKNGTRLFYAEDWCLSPTMKRIDALLDEGAVGDILYVKAKEVHSGTHSPFARDKKTCGGGSLLHLGVHPVGYLLHLVGKGSNPVVEVTGKTTGGLESNFVHKGNSGEDFGIGILRFQNGVFGFVEGNYITLGGMEDKVEIYGTAGVIKADLTHSSPIDLYSPAGVSYTIEKLDHNRGWLKPAVDEYYNMGYVSELAYFMDCVRFNREPFYGVSAEAGLACLEIIHALYESSATGRTVYGRWI
ncbi:MAG: Gfo/Idh/MocA family oxidoreductase [Acidobacteria bacterium]|nr:Gfo/Idh/MocA family oxidoreductase [Acidobacteriota bacterium]